MPFPFDVTLKELVESHPQDYCRLLGLDVQAPIQPLNVDLSTLSAATDVIFGYGDPLERIFDFNFQSGPDPHLDSRVLMYNVVLYHQCRVPVHSVIILLRPEADHQNLTGKLSYQGRPRKGKMTFTYEVIRLWQQKPEKYLRGGLGVLPLAVLCRLPEGVRVDEGLAPLVKKVIQRLTHEAQDEQRNELLTASYILTGMRVNQRTLDDLFRGANVMKESSGYQAIVREADIARLHKTILRLGTRQFGAPTQATEYRIQSIMDVPRLERMTDNVLDASSWEELLATQ